MIVYFSGTGNSRYVARLFAEALDDEMLDAAEYMKSGRRADVTSEKSYVFVSPTYAWRLPRVFERFIREGTFSGARTAYFVLTCGDGVGRADYYAAELCREKDMACRGLLPVVMPENYLALYDVPGDDQALAIRLAARPVIGEGIERVRAHRPFAPLRSSLRGHLQSRVVNPLFYRFVVTARPFYATDACAACGRCVEICPMRNIVLSDGKPHWGNDCTHCMACITACPAQAIEYGRRSAERNRYRCPERDADEA